MIGTYILFWFALVVVGITNGVVREMTYGRLTTELRAHQLSTLMGMLLSGTAVWVFARYFPIESERIAISTGVIWLALTVAFEFSFGRYVAGHSWKKLLWDYNLFAGRLWLLFLIWLLFLPYLVYKAGAPAA